MRWRAITALSIATGCSVAACLSLGDTESSSPSTGGSAGSSGGSAGVGGAPDGGTGGSAGGGAAGASGAAGADAGAPAVRVLHGNTALSQSPLKNEPLGTAVDLDKAALFLTTRHANAKPGEALVRGTLSANDLTFSRAATLGTTTVSWYVVEHSAFHVQRDARVLSSDTTAVTLPSPVVKEHAFALVSWESSGDSLGSNDYVVAELASPDTLTLKTVANQQNVSWQVVELTDGSTVQRGTTTLGATQNQGKGILVPPVDTSKSLLVYSYLVKGVSQTVDFRDAGVVGAVTSQSEVTFERGWTALAGLSPEVEVSWFVVELANAKVQSSMINLANGALSSKLQLGGSVNLERTFVALSPLGARWQGPFLSQVAGAESGMITAEIAPADTLVVTRDASGAPARTNPFVVTF